MPLRVSALRALGAYHERVRDRELHGRARGGGRRRPVEFRLRHLDDARAREVIDVAAENFGWRRAKRRGVAAASPSRATRTSPPIAPSPRGRSEPAEWPCAAGARVAAVDSGQVVNPDGLINQIEGAIVQSASWTLYESVNFDDKRITSIDWQTYPILRFARCPRRRRAYHRPPRPAVPRHRRNRQGPAAAAIANAIADATGKRMRDLPLTRQADQGCDRRVK